MTANEPRCRCLHAARQHSAIFGICQAPAAYAGLAGTAPLTGRICLCSDYQPESGPRLGWRERIPRIIRRVIR